MELKIDEKCENSFLFSFISSISEIKLIKCLNICVYPFSDKNTPCLLCTTDCPVFEVRKAKINVSDVINRPKSTDINTKLSLLLVLSVARTRFGNSTKNQTLNTCISWLNMQILYFPLCRGKVTVEPGIETLYAF